ncbi:hypothetical protein [Spiroplasma endosymbiont of Panorpa germanica]|uniref:hypothetical protein n=1 Tax=Spiroplasma endosymbiont of Panorpa germanica TaxID=3066314 RepID=UPI0030CA88D7
MYNENGISPNKRSQYEKIISLLAAFGLTTSASISAVACNTDSKNPGEPGLPDSVEDEAYLEYKIPETLEEIEKLLSEYNTKINNVVKELCLEVYGQESFPKDATAEQNKTFVNHENAQLYLANQIIKYHMEGLKFIIEGNKTQASNTVIAMKSLPGKLGLNNPDDEDQLILFVFSESNKVNLTKLTNDLENRISKI